MFKTFLALLLATILHIILILLSSFILSSTLTTFIGFIIYGLCYLAIVFFT